MKESFWAYFIVVVGMISIAFVFLFQTLTNSDEQLMTLLNESTEGAMFDAFDLASYRSQGIIRIDREKFAENFIRRFSNDASMARTYKIRMYDVNEFPPKVSIKISTIETGTTFIGGGNINEELLDYTISNTLDAILETRY